MNTLPAAAGAQLVERRVRVAAVAVAQCVGWGVLFYAFAIVLEAMEAALQASRAVVTGAFSAGLGASALAGFGIGRWVDRYGSRRVMLTGSLAASGLLVAWSRVETVGELYAVWVGLGLAMSAVLYEPAFAWVAAAYPEHRDEGFTWITVLGGLAATVFAPLATHLVAALGWRGALLTLAGIYAAVTIPVNGWALTTVRPPARGAAAGGVQPGMAGAGLDLSLSQALCRREFWILAAAFFWSSFAVVGLTVYVVPYLTGRGFTVHDAALALAAFGLFQSPTRLWVGPRLLRRSLAFLNALPVAVQALALVVLPLAGSRWSMLVAMGLFGAGNGLVTLSRAASVRNAFGPSAYGQVSGAMAAFPAAARALAPVGMGLFLGVEGRWGLTFTVLVAGLVAVALAAAWGLGRRPVPSPELAGGPG